MKITLVSIHPHPSPQAVPLACAFLKEALLAERSLAGKVEVELAEFFLSDAPERCAEAILATAPDLVGFSVYVWSRDHALAIVSELKRRAPHVAVCAGGAEATANPAGLLDPRLLDFVVVGEGEASFVQAVGSALEGLPPEGVPGIALPGAALPGFAAPIDIDTIPSPYLTGRLDPTRAGGALWQLSRGCDFACSFCFDDKGGRGVRRFSLDRIEEELRLFARLGVPQVFVLDSTFNKIPQRAKEILRLIRKLAPQVHFHFEVRSEYLDPEMAELFASITCSLQIGLQSADAGVLRAVGRGFDPDDFSYRISLLNGTGAIFGFDLIYGLPDDTLAKFRSSLDYALGLYPNHLDIFPLAVLPGTRLYRKAADLGLDHLAAPPYTVQATPTFSPTELSRAGLLATACDIFYSRGKAVAWFNAVAGAVKLSPSAFLEAFARFLNGRANSEEEIPDDEIPILQRDFLAAVFKERKKEKLLPLALDLVEYHHHYACALMTPPPKPPAPKALRKMDLLRTPFKLAPSARLGRFNYEILDILEAGDIDLAEFASCFRPAESYAVVYPAAGEVCTESISRLHYLFLSKMDGTRSGQQLCKELRLPVAEMIPFLEFAVSDGIVTLP